MRDLHNNAAVVEAIAPAEYDDDNTPAAIDLQGFEAVELVLHIGAGGITFTGTNKIEVKLTHSDDDSTYDAVTVDDVLGLDSVGTGGIVESLTSAHPAATITQFGYIGNKRYLKLLADFGGTHSSGTPISAVVIKARPLNAPA